jgi:hypothetical protein
MKLSRFFCATKAARVFCLPFVLVVACGGAATPKPATPQGTEETAASGTPGAAEQPKSNAAFKELLAREVAPGKKYPIKVLDGAVQFELEAQAAPDVQSASTNGGTAGARIMVKGFGEDSFACTALGDTLELGSTLATVSETLQFTEMPSIEVGSQGPYATVIIEGLYASKKNPSTGGTLKIGALYGAGGSILCAEGSAGYSKSFRRVMKSLFASAKIAKDKDVYSEGFAVKVQGEQLGLGFQHLRKEGPGYVLYEYGFLLAKGEGKWAAHSFVENSTYDAKGVITNKVIRDVLMGKPVGGIEFQRKSASSFGYHMVREGKESEGVVQLKAPTMSLGSHLAYKKAASGKSGTFSNLRLEADPVAQFTLSKGEGGTVLRTQGKDVTDVVLDANGYVTKMSGTGLMFELLGRDGKVPEL